MAFQNSNLHLMAFRATIVAAQFVVVVSLFSFHMVLVVQAGREREAAVSAARRAHGEPGGWGGGGGGVWRCDWPSLIVF